METNDRPRILVVDDNEANRRVARAHIQRLDAEATLAGDGRTALDLLSVRPFDLVLLDGMMPGMDGPATAREIRRREHAAALPPIPIVALTASVLPEERELLLEAGMDDHVAKPFRPEDIARALVAWLPPERRTMVIPAPAAGAAAEPAARSAEPAGPEDVLVDPAALARLSDIGDSAFVDRIVRLFLADAAERVTQVDEALEAGDVSGLRLALHALEGICGTVGAVALDRRAREIHARIGRGKDGGREGVASGPGPSGLDELLERTRAWFREASAEGRRG